MTSHEKTLQTQRKVRCGHRTLQAIKDNLPMAPNLDHIINAVLEHYTIPKKVFFSNLSYRGKDFVMTRQWVSYFGYRYHYTMEQIGQAISRDHSSITYGAKAINTMLDVYPAATAIRTAILQRIKRLVIDDLSQFNQTSNNSNHYHNGSSSNYFRPYHRLLISSSMGIHYANHNRIRQRQLGEVQSL